MSRMVDSSQIDIVGFFLKLKNAETNTKAQKSEPLRSEFTGTKGMFGQAEHICHK